MTKHITDPTNETTMQFATGFNVAHKEPFLCLVSSFNQIIDPLLIVYLEQIDSSRALL